MNQDDLHILIERYILGDTDPQETRQVRERLAAGDPAYVGTLAETEATLAQLALAVDPVEPPASVEQRLMARVDGGDTTGATGRAAESLKFPGWASGLIGLAAGVIIAVGIMTAMQPDPVAQPDPGQSERIAALEKDLAEARGQIETLETQVNQSVKTIQLIQSRPTRIIALRGTESQPEAWGRVLWNPETAKWQVYVDGLAEPQGDEVYELWAITASDKRIPAAIFTVDESGSALLNIDLPDDIDEIALAAITNEPAGGSPQPTGTIHILGKFE